MESVNESFNRLYAALTPEQKAAADKHFSAAGRHQHGPGRGRPTGAPGAAAEPRKG
jgi:Spy/CpxP family protein refolding chaperone